MNVIIGLRSTPSGTVAFVANDGTEFMIRDGRCRVDRRWIPDGPGLLPDLCHVGMILSGWFAGPRLPATGTAGRILAHQNGKVALRTAVVIVVEIGAREARFTNDPQEVGKVLDIPWHEPLPFLIEPEADKPLWIKVRPV